MGTMLLIIGLVAIAGALVTIVIAASSGAGQATGVARSLELIEKTVNQREVSKSDLPAMERLVAPLARIMRHVPGQRTKCCQGRSKRSGLCRTYW